MPKIYITYFDSEELDPIAFTEITKPENTSNNQKIKNIEKFLYRTDLDIRKFDDQVYTIVVLSNREYMAVVHHQSMCELTLNPWNMFPHEPIPCIRSK